MTVKSCYLVDVSPVPVIFQAFPEHCHDLVAGHHIVGKIREVSHLSAGWAPWVIRSCFSHLQKKQSRNCQCVRKYKVAKTPKRSEMPACDKKSIRNCHLHLISLC